MRCHDCPQLDMPGPKRAVCCLDAREDRDRQDAERRVRNLLAKPAPTPQASGIAIVTAAMMPDGTVPQLKRLPIIDRRPK